MSWASVAPRPNRRRRPNFDATDPAAYPQAGWGRYDNLFQVAGARGIEVHVTLTGGAPKWATKAKRDNVTRPLPGEFRRFAIAAGRRYGSRVAIWSIWNEPNQYQFLLPQYVRGKPASPRIYRGLYRAGRSGLIAAGNAGDKILFGETSPRGNSRVVRPLRFLRGALCLNRRYKKVRKCGKLDMGGYAHHPYTTSVGPRFVPPSPDDVTMGVVGRLERALDRAARAGAVPKRVGLYLTEFGIQSKPDPSAVTLRQQAEFLAQSERLAYLNPRVKTFSQYLMNDDSPGEGSERFGGFESGLRRHGGRRKPSYDGFRTPLAVQDYGRSDVGWGLVRPATGATTVQILFRNGKRGAYKRLKTVQTQANTVFAFRTRSRAGRTYRVRWTSPEGRIFTGPPIRAYK